MAEIIVIIIIIILLIMFFTINTIKKEKTKISELNYFYDQLHKLNYEIFECKKKLL